MSQVDSDSEVQFNDKSLQRSGQGDQSDHVRRYSISADEEDDQEAQEEHSRSSSPVRQMQSPERRNNHNYRQVQEHQRRNQPRMPGLRWEDDSDLAPTRKRGPNLKPDTFNGEEDWDSYITHFEICAELGRWSSRETALTLAASLRGQARVFYMNLTAREKFSYRELVRKLSQRFGNCRQQAMWLSRLESRQRQEGETIAKFGDEVLQLAQRAHPGLSPFAQEAVALNQLYKSIVPELKYQCITSDCQTMAHAVEIIDTYEGIVLGDKKKNKVRVVSKSDEPNFVQLEEKIQKLTESVERLERRQKSEPTEYGPRLCYKCQSPDHLIRNCPQGRSRQHQRNSRTSQNYQQQNSGN